MFQQLWLLPLERPRGFDVTVGCVWLKSGISGLRRRYDAFLVVLLGLVVVIALATLR
jgi:hypothetical protein